MAKITVERTLNISLDRVWEVAADFMQSPGSSITVIPGKSGNPAAYGIGSERSIKFGKFSTTIQERLVSVDPKNSFEFSVISGAPVKSLLIKAEFVENGRTTQTKWTATFEPKSIFLCLIVHMVIKRNINMILNELEKIKVASISA